jgi:beta-galactosidase beta subunit
MQRFCKEQLDLLSQMGRKWQRVIEASHVAETLEQGATWSIGDSLTYRWDTCKALSTADYVGRRRYLTVIVPLDGTVCIEVERKRDLVPTEPYSDLTDRELFEDGPHSPSREEVMPSQVLVIDRDEAARVIGDKEVRAVELHVTVEGSSFANK